MSKVYTVNGGINESDHIPSMQYINELKKIIEDAIIDCNINFNGFRSIVSEKEELPIANNETLEVFAKDIKTDSQHKFINDGILATIVDKPTKFEMEQMLLKSKEELINFINEIYMRIINTPNVINKLRDISNILSEDEIGKGIIETLSYKLNIQDFDEHKNSFLHMNNNDRKALNVLLKCLLEGFADWNADKDSYNAIKNKPNSLPANGGNADTVANHGINDLINRDDYDIVVGESGQKYSKDSCDIYCDDDGIIDSDILNGSIKSLKNGGTVLFKRGDYVVDYISCHNNIIVLKGFDYRFSCITARDFISISDSVLKDISVVDSNVHIKSNCEINNVHFTHCTITLKNSNDCNITNCVFDNCKIKINGKIMNNIIKHNRFTYTKPITYLGGNNIITENI